MPRTEEDRRRLINLYKDGDLDRSAPLVFAGRKRELALLTDKIERAVAGGAGMSSVIHGIPGSGKTSLGREFCRRAEADGAVAVYYYAGSFGSKTGLAKSIETRVAQRKSVAGRLVRHVAERKVEVRAMGFGASVGPLDKDREWNLGEILDAMGVPAARPVVCHVDEAQHLTDDAKSLMGDLHDGIPGRIILPIYVGTPHTVGRLRELGLYRFAGGTPDPIGPLATEEARESIEGACREFGVAEEASELIAPLLAEATQGFPAHIASAVAAVAWTMRENGYGFSLDKVDDCLDRAKALRSRYYDARLDTAGNPPIPLLAPLARAAKQSPDGWAKETSVEDEYEAARVRWKSRRRPPAFADMLDACEQAGAVRLSESADGDSIFQFAAPSLADAILERHARILGSNGRGGVNGR